MKQTLAICDLNAAVAAKDKQANLAVSHTQICLLAQFAYRITGKKVVGSVYGIVHFEEERLDFKVQGIGKLIRQFDSAFLDWPPNGDHNIAIVRRQLPLEVEVDYEG